MGMSMGVIRVPGILHTLERRNHWVDSLQIKFFGTVLACRRATCNILVICPPRPLRGVISSLGPLFTGQGPSSHLLIYLCIQSGWEYEADKLVSGVGLDILKK